jgi:hypothetical protein
MEVNGTMRASYDAGEDMNLAPPTRDETMIVPLFGWSAEPTVTYRRPYPGDWKLLGYSLEVSS